MRNYVSIVGAGIGGLTHAIALAHRGIHSEILERAPQIAEVGAGVQISPNGMAVLRALGLGDALEKASIESRAVHLTDGLTGRSLIRMPMKSRDYRLVHRATLIAILEGAARDAGVTIRPGTRVESAQDGTAATFVIDGGTEETGFAVGADGINSVLRPALNGTDRAEFTGQVAWRATIAADAPPEAQIFVGPGRHLVAYPLSEGRLNLVAVEERADWAEEGWHVEGDPDALRRAFAGFASPVADWLRIVETCHLWGLYVHPVARVWHGRSMALLGDAAHPTLPFLGQGANLALEDAWCLAAALSRDDRDAALADYHASRAPRVARAIAMANSNARNYHLSGAIKAAAHAGLKLANLAPGIMLKRFDWLYGHDVTAEPSM
ncbi:FAD-dependent monooxygenase [Palleronia sp. LCG004]|uniref:FAD-dependent monooxygenase n=1 Tax=Palleronia sp. LCG004 TaxID=3079304 RepID=UPI002942163E|nr:FAD-dependent monooxygenase [Palleronia sp. LCG004]WOI55173.1 FAD-dependent monooxygenase [Palleronia sp. LCG004]